METEHSPLAQFVTRVIREKRLSLRDVSARSGGGISYSTVGEIANGQRVIVKSDTLRALARGLGVSEDAIFRAARGLDPNGGESQYARLADHFDAHDLTAKEWAALEILWTNHIEQMRREKQAITDAAASSRPGPVVATIEPGERSEVSAGEIRRMVFGDIDYDTRPARRRRKT